MEVRIVSKDGLPFRCHSNFLVEPQAAMSTIKEARRSGLLPLKRDQQSLGRTIRRDVAWVLGMHDRGALVASVCAGAIGMAVAGSLDGCDSALLWGLWSIVRAKLSTGSDSKELRASPSCRGGRHSNRRRRGLLARTGHLSDGDVLRPQTGLREPQDSYACESRIRPTALCGDEPAHRTHDLVISEFQRWLALNFTLPNPVQAMTARVGLKGRTLARRSGRPQVVRHRIRAGLAD